MNPYHLFKSDFNEQKKNYYYNYAKETIFVQNHLAPHIYSVVASILHDFHKNNNEVDFSRNHCINISGESGSGKSKIFELVVDF